MRFIQTFLVHLYVDSEAPGRVCGSVRPLEGPESYPFKNPVEFEALLCRLVSQRSAALTTPSSSATSQEK
jgi:hypothetical protein